MSICDKNNPPERSDKEIELSRLERDKAESIIREEDLNATETPAVEVEAVVTEDQNEFNKLARIQTSIDAVTTGENEFNIPEIQKQVESDGLTVDVDQLIRIANIQNVAFNTTGEGVNFKRLNNRSDCGKSIDKLLIQQLKKMIMKIIRNSNSADEILAALASIPKLEFEIGNIFALAKDAKNKSLAELLIDARNVGLLERVDIIKTIREKFGPVVSNLNNIIANIDSFDICNMLDVTDGGIDLPTLLRVGPRAAARHPDPGDLIRINTNRQKTKADFIDHTSRAGDLINGVYSSNDLESDPSYGSMLTALNSFYYGVKSEVITNGTEGVEEKTEREIQRVVDARRDEWSGDILNEFRERSTNVSNLLIADASVLQADAALRNA